MNIKYQRKLLLIDERTSSILRLKANFRTCWRILEFTVSDFHWEEHNFGKTSFLKLFTHDINNEWQCSVAVCHLKMFVSSSVFEAFSASLLCKHLAVCKQERKLFKSRNHFADGKRYVLEHCCGMWNYSQFRVSVLE